MGSEAALAARGFKVFPIAPGRKFPPLVADWPAVATTEPATLWLAAPENANVGIHCEGLVVLDIDTAKGGRESIQRLELFEDIPPTLTCRTPSGGEHRFYRLPVGHRGVPNSVGLLARGIDTRSTRGYVVGAGSRTDAGAYEWVDESAEIAEAPEWLVARLGEAKEARTHEEAPVADAPDAIYEAAFDWLAGQPGAVEGQGGDAHTFAVACGLRDRGVSQQQAVELLLGWNEKCSPPWTTAELQAKVRNAYRYAQNEAASRVAVPADFPVVDAAPAQKPRSKVRRLAEFASSEAKGPGYVIKGLLQRRSYACVYGAPGEGKTFVALDMAYHVAAGKDWMGKKVHAGPVLYLAFEGEGGLVKRAQALRQHYGNKDVPLYVAGAQFNVRELAGRAELGEMIAGLPEKPVLVVVDTFARALMGGDENSAQDVGAFNSAVAALIESTGACVCIIHHSGKDKSKGARGSSAILGALDTEIMVDEGTVEATKQRDVDLGDPVGFKLVPLVVGVDSDGDEVTSCVVEGAAVVKKGGRLTGNMQRGFEVLAALSPTNKPVTLQVWRDACAEEFLGGKSVAARFSDIKRGLVVRGFINVDDTDLVTRKLE